MEARNRRKRPKIRLLALGLAAAAAVAAPAAQAMPEGLDGTEARMLQESRHVAVADRAAPSVPSAQPPTVFSPDDRSLNRASYQQQASPSVVSDSGGFEPGTVATSVLVLLLAAGGMTALAIHRNQPGGLANA